MHSARAISVLGQAGSELGFNPSEVGFWISWAASLLGAGPGTWGGSGAGAADIGAGGAPMSSPLDLFSQAVPGPPKGHEGASDARD